MINSPPPTKECLLNRVEKKNLIKETKRANIVYPAEGGVAEASAWAACA